MSLITLNISKPFAELKLTRASRRNALTEEMILEISSALDEVSSSDARGLIISADGPAFCAGHDFSDMHDRDLDKMMQLMQNCSAMMQKLPALPQVVIAKVQGPALGAGFQLILSCDLVVASNNTFFCTPGGKGGWFCTTPMVEVCRAASRKRALEMLLTGEPISVEQALEWGMINRVVSSEDLDSTTEELLSNATRGSAKSTAMGKEAFYTQIDFDKTKAYEYATRVMAETGVMPDAKERMAAFMEKRKPEYK